MTVKEAAIAIVHGNGLAKAEAEKMIGCKFEAMTKAQRMLAAECIAAFYDSEKDIATKTIARATK